jgi:hypothetical protein
MRDLLKKYPLGYEGYRLEKGLVDPATANALAFDANQNIVAEGFQPTASVGTGEAVAGGQSAGIGQQAAEQKVYA